jgi:Leucine Rich Repeat/Leucine Rich repeat
VLLETIGSQSSIELLNLARNEDIGPSFDFSGYGLPLFPRLRMLDLSGCGLDARTCFSLATAMTTFGGRGDLEDHVTSRGVLSLNLNTTDLRDSEYFSKMMNRLFTFLIVSEMFLSGCQLGDEGLRQILDACSDSSEGSTIPKLQVLDLSNNNLTQDALQDFFSKLVENNSRQCHLRQLRKLNLSGNTLDEESCNHLAACIAEGPLESLCDLDVSKTSCGVNGAVALIRSNNTDGSSRGVKILNLFGNQLGSEGFVHLSKHLEGGHPILESLDLGGNEATEAGIVAVLQPLIRQNCTGKKNALRLLVVGGNQGGPTVETLVKDIQTMHPELDVARDKPGRNQNSNSNNPLPSSTWTA